VRALPIDGRLGRARRRAAASFLDCYPDLAAWMARPTAARLVDLQRSNCWPLLSWCVLEGHLIPDLELLLAKPGGVDLPALWAERHSDGVARLAGAGKALGWSENWTQ